MILRWKFYAMIDHEVIERRMQWHSKKELLNVFEQVVSVTWFDLIFCQKWWIWRLDDGVYVIDLSSVGIIEKNWKYENMKIWRLAASFNWVTGFWRAHTHSEWATLQYCQVYVLEICNRCLWKETIVLKPKITFLACCFLKLLCEGTYSIVLT